MLGYALSLLGRAMANGKLSILIYHQVLAEPDPMRPSEPTAAVFDWQMALLARHFAPVSLDAAVEGLAEGTLPANAACVTFDDGYLNNLTVAQPILAKYSIPATVYVATAFSHGLNMWNDRVINLFSDPTRNVLVLDGEELKLESWSQRRDLAELWLRRLKYLPVQERLQAVAGFYEQNSIEEQSPQMMSPAQIRALSAAGTEIGAHTVNHPILMTLSAEEQASEIRDSKAILEEWTGKPVRHFAYPNGVWGKDLDVTTAQRVREAGFSTAVTTEWGVSDRGTSPWLLKRFTPWDSVPWRFHLRLFRNQASTWP